MAGHIRCAFRQFDTPTSNLGMTTHPRDLIKQNRNRNHHRGCLHIPSSPPPHIPGPDLESSAGPTAAGPRLLTEWHCSWGHASVIAAPTRTYFSEDGPRFVRDVRWRRPIFGYRSTA